MKKLIVCLMLVCATAQAQSKMDGTVIAEGRLQGGYGWRPCMIGKMQYDGHLFIVTTESGETGYAIIHHPSCPCITKQVEVEK